MVKIFASRLGVERLTLCLEILREVHEDIVSTVG